mmetsp:Transcript_82798/g.182005  ORF Transcript_82798/g.182005 Transcript_82798/m.182005 type:complete len:415 (-) Transcript_82798:730-1974(-)
MLLRELEGLVPAMGFHVEVDEHTHIPDLEDGLLGERIVLMLSKCLDGHIKGLRIRRRQQSNDLDEAVQSVDADEDFEGLFELTGSGVHLPCSLEVAILFRGGSLLEDEALRDGGFAALRVPAQTSQNTAAAHAGRGPWEVRDGVGAGAGPGLDAGLLALLRPMLRFVPLSKLSVHLDGRVELLRLPEVLRSVEVLALEGQHLCRDKMFLLRREARAIPVLLSDSVQQVDVPHVPNPNEGLPSDVEAERLQRVEGEETPVGLRYTEAGDFVGNFEVLLLDVAVERGTLGDVDGLHGDVVQTEDLGALEADDEALQFLHVRREISSFDAEHVAAAIGQHVLHLCVPGHTVRVGLLVQQGLGVQIVHEEVRSLIDNCQFLPTTGEIEAAYSSCLLDQRHRERVVDEDLHDMAVLEAH